VDGPEVEDPADAIVILDNSCAVCAAESVDRIVKVDVPACVGVPEMAPDEAFRVRPEGSAPVSVHL
jgi:hypothetical protein